MWIEPPLQTLNGSPCHSEQLLRTILWQIVTSLYPQCNFPKRIMYAINFISPINDFVYSQFQILELDIYVTKLFELLLVTWIRFQTFPKNSSSLLSKFSSQERDWEDLLALFQQMFEILAYRHSQSRNSKVVGYLIYKIKKWRAVERHLLKNTLP